MNSRLSHPTAKHQGRGGWWPERRASAGRGVRDSAKGTEANTSFLEAICNREICILTTVGRLRPHRTPFPHHHWATDVLKHVFLTAGAHARVENPEKDQDDWSEDQQSYPDKTLGLPKELVFFFNIISLCCGLKKRLLPLVFGVPGWSCGPELIQLQINVRRLLHRFPILCT